jgi:hypothetical protein
MDQANWKPEVGQEVVAIYGGVLIKKGQAYRVYAIRQCSNCGRYKVDLGFREHGTSLCNGCNANYEKGNIYWIDSSRVAPVNPYSVDLTKELADSFKESPECPDKVIVPEKVNN